MNLLLGLAAILTWILSDIWMGIKIKKTGNAALKALLISVNVVFVLFAVVLLYI